MAVNDKTLLSFNTKILSMDTNLYQKVLYKFLLLQTASALKESLMALINDLSY